MAQVLSRVSLDVDGPVAIAHRAGNDRAALAEALRAGVDWVETDLCWYRGQLVARHEKALWRLPVLYDKWKLSLASGQPLCLPEICRTTRGGPQLLLDLKGTGRRLPLAIAETLRDEAAVDRAAICGQYWGSLDAARSVEPSLRAFYSFGGPAHLEAMRARPADLPRIEAASVEESLLTLPVLAEFRERGISVIAWTVNEPERARELLAGGVMGITSDRLDILATLHDFRPTVTGVHSTERASIRGVPPTLDEERA